MTRATATVGEARPSFTAKRTLLKSGGSTVLALPPPWLEVTGLPRSDQVPVTLRSDELVIRPARGTCSSEHAPAEGGDLG